MESFPCGDLRLPHHIFPPKFIQQTQLTELAGVHLYKVDMDDTMAMKKRLTRVREQWNLSEMTEPTESDDCVCLVLEGEMYYDIEFDDEKWLRIHLQRGDLIIVPKGIFYRSTVTPTNFVKIQRFNKLRQTSNG
uniref:Uncharacterized protein n=1 Tax=Meloidogyne incognita TaxID=6306 RepID=A0A914NTI8_MELIC